MQIGSIAVIGAGTMGNGIAQVCAVAGVPVTLTDIAQSQIDRAMKNVEGSLDRLVKKEKMTEDAKSKALGRITTSTDLGAVGAEQGFPMGAPAGQVDCLLEGLGGIHG